MQLVRDFIRHQLYAPRQGYFTTHTHIHRLPRPIDFVRLKGQDEYLREVDRLYQTDKGQESWHTPAEVLRPWYGRAIARCALQVVDDRLRTGVTIVEVGAGNGAVMADVLDTLRDVAGGAVYRNSQYHCVDISEAMLSRQQERAQSAGHGDRVHFHHASFLNWAWVPPSDKPCVIVATEVLDNLEHDKIIFPPSHGATETPMETLVSSDPSGRHWEEYRPVQDPLILEYLQLRTPGHPPRGVPAASLFSRLTGAILRNRTVAAEFVPTGALQFLKKLARLRHDRCILADFHWLPDTIEGGFYDIFFPTDFAWLGHAYNRLVTSPPSRSSTTMSQPDFLRRYLTPPELQQGRTRSGFNPLVDDYQNVSFFVTSGSVELGARS